MGKNSIILGTQGFFAQIDDALFGSFCVVKAQRLTEIDHINEP
jgi:hypothetical protein